MKTELKPQGCTNLKLRQIMRRVTQLYDAELAQADLKTTQYSMLTHVVKLGPVRPVDLAQLMHMSASTLSRNLQPLIASGWVQVEPGADARSRMIHATPAGHAKRREAQRKWRLAQEQLNATLGPERVAALHALIDASLELLTQPETNDVEP
ncbi:MAG: hypothetical protein RIT26_2321 [Pseudomonadota bacterium]|jgi:DNA-binding MarR family transcriptional regulator